MANMTPKQRAAAIAQGLPVDRLPCNPNIANGAARVHGCKISAFNTDPKAFAGAQVSIYRRFGCDGLRIFCDLFAWAEAMGATVHAPDDATVDLARPAINSVSEIGKLRPPNPYKDGRLPVHLAAMDYLRDAVGDEVGCSAGMTGPFSNAFFLYGVDDSFRLIRKNPKAFHELCKVSLESCLLYAEASIEKGLTPTISEPMSSCSVVSPQIFREFSLPYLTTLVNFIKSKGFSPVIHICGETKFIWEDIADMGVSGFSVDNVIDLKACCEKIGSKTKIMGHVDPGGIVYAGSPLDVRRETLKCILQGYDSPKGFVVMSGCSLPVETPFVNIDAMMQTVSDVGFPVQQAKVQEMLSEVQEEQGRIQDE